MSTELNNVIIEAERLLSLSSDSREQEGVYAGNNQLKFLIKKLKSASSKPSILNGADKFISDLASSDSKILALLDKFRESQNS